MGKRKRKYLIFILLNIVMLFYFIYHEFSVYLQPYILYTTTVEVYGYTRFCHGGENCRQRRGSIILYEVLTAPFRPFTDYIIVTIVGFSSAVSHRWESLNIGEGRPAAEAFVYQYKQNARSICIYEHWKSVHVKGAMPIFTVYTYIYSICVFKKNLFGFYHYFLLII